MLYPAPLRDFLVELAAGGLFRAKWTAQIHGEWKRTLLQNRKDISEYALDRTIDLLNKALPDGNIEGFEDLIEGLHLPDPNDRHVLAAAIYSGCDGIVTVNIRDFPQNILAKYQIERLHPDDFIHHQFGLDNPSVLIAARRCRERLKNPPKTVEEYLATLERQSLPKTVAELRKYASVL